MPTPKSITAATNDGSSATVSVTTAETSATSVGDLVVVVHGNNYYTLAAMATPTATGSPTMNAITGAVADAGSNLAHIKGYWYVANTAGAQTISATETGAHDEEKYIVAYVFSGADTTTAIDASANATGTGTSAVAPSVSPASTSAYVVAAANSGGGAPVTAFTTPSPLTEDGEIHVGGLGGVYASAQLAAAGATGTFSFDMGSTRDWAAVTIAVLPSAGGATAPPRPAVVSRAAIVRASNW